jgi:mercuric ion binding protein
MMNKSIWLAVLLAPLFSPALAAQQTVTLAVPGMTCAACPITVKKALSKVAGVDKAEVDYEKRQATVTFDDAKTDVAKLTRATADAGYPSSVKGANR